MRNASIERKTKETEIFVKINIDGMGNHEIDTPVPFLNHMLSLMAMHGLFDLEIKAKGDVEVDDHHTVEDVGIVLGIAFRKALSDMKGIIRYGNISIPMDETLASIAVDISGRPFLAYNVSLPKRSKIKDFDVDLIQDFLQAFVANSGITLHVNVLYGRNTHHIIEAIFKGIGRALREAVKVDPKLKGIPSTKGRIG
jgi:imidazoleglycerol-phosphate dehydratase